MFLWYLATDGFYLCICGFIIFCAFVAIVICASVASSFSVHLWQCRVVAHQPQGIQVDEFHLRLVGVLRVKRFGFIDPVAKFMGCNAHLCRVVGNGHPAFSLTGSCSSICCASRVLCVMFFFTFKDSCAIDGQKDGVDRILPVWIALHALTTTNLIATQVLFNQNNYQSTTYIIIKI